MNKLFNSTITTDDDNIRYNYVFFFYNTTEAYYIQLIIIP